MGDPATPTPADRLATQQLARDIVQSVIDDGPMPLDLHATPSGMVARWEVELLVFQLAQELVKLRRELDEALEGWRDEIDDEYGETAIERKASSLARIAKLRGKP